MLVGDINAVEGSALIDDLFGDVACQSELRPLPKTPVLAKAKVASHRDAVPAIGRACLVPMASTAKTRISCRRSCSTTSSAAADLHRRLMEQVREKRGLAYGVYTAISALSRRLDPDRVVSPPRTKQMSQSIDVIQAEFRRWPTRARRKTELDNAKSYLIGSFPLRFDTNSKIANQLLVFFQEDFGIDYVDRRNAEIEKVTLDDLRRAAKRIFNLDDLFVTVVGKPTNLPPKS